MSSSVGEGEMIAGKTDKTLQGSVSVRAIVVSIVLLCFLAFIFVKGELIYGELNAILELDNAPNSGSLGPIVLLALLINPLLRKIGKRWHFSAAELASIYGVLLIGAPTIGIGLVGHFPFQLMGLQALSIINAKTYSSVLDRFPTLIMPKSEDALFGFLYGDAKVPWLEWIGPMLIWMVFWGVVFFWMLCIASLVRKQWTEYEHLRYPIAEASFSALNVHETKKEYGSSKLLWVGFAISVVFILLERIRNYFPAFPPFLARWVFEIVGWKIAKLNPVVDQAFQNHWWMPAINPLFIGIGYLVRTDLLFSVWFFYLFTYALLILYSSRGLLGYQGIPNLRQQTIGAFTALALYLLWIARFEIRNIFRKAFLGSKAGADDSDEPLSYRLVVFGGFAAACFIVLFNFVFLQIRPLVTLVFLAFTSMGALAVARIRTDAGIGWGRIYSEMLERQLVPIFGGMNVWHMDSVVNHAGLLYSMGRSGLGAATASSLELYKMADLAGMKRKSMAGVIVFGFLAAFLIGFYMVLTQVYTEGSMVMNVLFVNWGYNGWWIQDAINPASGQSNLFTFAPIGLGYFLGAGVFTAVLMFLSSRFPWWPFHPIGYAVSTFSWMFVGGFFVAWLIKVLVLRYGGFETYKKLLPLFIGVIIGQVFAETIDGLIRLVTMI